MILLSFNSPGSERTEKHPGVGLTGDFAKVRNPIHVHVALEIMIQVLCIWM